MGPSEGWGGHRRGLQTQVARVVPVLWQPGTAHRRPSGCTILHPRPEPPATVHPPPPPHTGGLTLNFLVAIDYTASNRDPRDPYSLHHLGAPTTIYEGEAPARVDAVLRCTAAPPGAGGASWGQGW